MDDKDEELVRNESGLNSDVEEGNSMYSGTSENSASTEEVARLERFWKRTTEATFE